LSYEIIIGAAVGGIIVGATATTLISNRATTYNECVLQEMKGQPGESRITAWTVCRERFPKDD
jgi:hypothetical protein